MMIMVVGWSALAQVYAGGCMLEYSWGVCQGLCGEWNSQKQKLKEDKIFSFSPQGREGGMVNHLPT